MAEAAEPRNLSRNTAVMAVGTLLSRITGFGRVFALAYVLGFDRMTDTYQLANTTPNIVYELVLGGVLAATLVPVFVQQLSSKDEDEAWHAISAVVTLATVALLVLTVTFALVAPWVIHLYTINNDTASVHDQRAVATFLLRLFAPQLLFYGLISVTTALLNARRRFAAPMFAPVFNNLIVIGVLLALPSVADNLGLASMRGDTSALLFLGLGTTVGVAAMALAQLPSLRRSKPRLRFVWEPGHQAVRQVLRLSGWTVGFVAANQIALWLVYTLANGRAGDLSAYTAAYIFFLLPHGIFAVSVMTALQPELSEHWTRNDLPAYRREFSLGLRMTALVLLPAAAGFIALARPIVSTVLEYGALDASSAAKTADVLALMAIGLPAFSAYLLIMRAFQAMQDTRTVFFLYVAENAANIVLALALYPKLRVQGLALAFALAYIAGTLVSLLALRRRTAGIDGRAIVASVTKIGAATAAMTIAVVAVSYGGSQIDLVPVIRLGAAVAVGVTVYLAAARALRVGELAMFLKLRRRAA